MYSMVTTVNNAILHTWNVPLSVSFYSVWFLLAIYHFPGCTLWCYGLWFFFYNSLFFFFLLQFLSWDQLTCFIASILSLITLIAFCDRGLSASFCLCLFLPFHILWIECMHRPCIDLFLIIPVRIDQIRDIWKDWYGVSNCIILYLDFCYGILSY